MMNANVSSGANVGSTSLADHVCDLLLDQIVTFKLKPFEVLSEKRISESVGVSRTPVREALARLAGQRLVDIYPQRGTFVAPLRHEDLARSQFMREALEVGLVQRVTAMPDRAVLVKQLRAEVELQKMFSKLDDDTRFYGSDEDFHRAIATFAGLPGIWDEIKRGKVHMDRCRRLALATLDKEVGVVADQHQAIVDAIEGGDARAAAVATRKHLRRILDFVEKIPETYPEYVERSPTEVQASL